MLVAEAATPLPWNTLAMLGLQYSARDIVAVLKVHYMRA